MMRLGHAARALVPQRWNFWSVVTVAGLVVFIVLLIIPLGQLVISSFADREGTFSADEDFGVLATYVEFFSFPYYYQTLLNSFYVSALATLFAVLIGFPTAYLVNRYDLPGKLLIRVSIVLTFVSPPFIGAYAWVLLLGRSGVITGWLANVGISVPSIYGWRGIVLVFTLQAFPFVFLLVSAGLRSIDQSIEDAATNLGRPVIGVIRTALVPLLIPAISTGALLVFVTTFADFGTPMIIGEGYRVLATLIYTEFINEFGGNPRRASTFSLLLLTITVGALLIQRWFAARRSFGQESVRPLGIRTLPPGKRLAASLFVYGVVFTAFLPSFTVIVSSFLESQGPMLLASFSIDGYREALRLPLALRNTLVFVSTATVIAVTAGALIGYVIVRRPGRIAALLDTMSMVPYAVAGVVLGVALSLAFGGPPFLLAGTGAILVLAYFIRRLPYSVRSVSGMLQQVGVQTEEASINLGVPPGRTFWRITVPQITPAILSGALLTWATTAREFNATVMLYSGRTRTLPVEVFAQVLQGNFGAASVVGTVLIVVTVVPIVILFKVFGKDEEVLV